MNASYLVLCSRGTSQICLHNLSLIESQWLEHMQQLQRVIEAECVQTDRLIDACAKCIERETFETQSAVLDNQLNASNTSLTASTIVCNTLSIAKRAQRIAQLAEWEADNSEDTG